MLPIVVMLIGLGWIIACVDFLGLPGLFVGLLGWGAFIAILGYVRKRLDPMRAYQVERGITPPPSHG